MKQYNYLLYSRKCLVLLLLCGFSLNLMAQDKPNKLSASVVLGVPVTFFSIKSKPIGIYTGAVRYSASKSWSFEAKVTANTFYNNATGNPYKATLDGTASDVKSYRTPVYGFNGVVYYNFHNLFGLNKRPEIKWLPFVSLGAGLNMYKPTVTYTNGVVNQSTKFGKPYKDYQIGIGSRYYLNANLDLFGGIEYHISETYYLDGFKEKSNPGLDQYMNFYAGVSVKFGAKPWNNLIDWSHKNIENPNESPKVYSKWALDGTLGIPFLFTPVGHNITGMVGIGVRRSFNRAMGLQFNMAFGRVSGDQETSSAFKKGDPNSIKEFSSSLNQYSVRAFFNIRNLASEPQSRADWNHYAILGAGFTSSKGDVTYSNGVTKTDVKLSTSPGIQTIVVGYEARKYYNHYLDFIGGVDFGYNQTKYIDQAYNKPTLNNHLYFHAGVTYKLGTTKDKEHIDWSYQNYNNFKDKRTTLEQVPVIEKPVTEQPKIVDSSAVVAPAPAVAPTPEPAPVVAPTPTPAPTPAPAVAVAPVVPPAKEEPKKAIVEEPKPAPAAPVEPKPVVKPNVQEPANNGDLTPPPAKYSVIVACYSVNKEVIARKYMTKLSKMGYEPSLYQTTPNSKIIRLSVISTDDRNEALQILRKARKELEPQSWIYLYNKQ